MRLSKVNCRNFMDYMTKGYFEKEKQKKDKGELFTFLCRVKEMAERHVSYYDKENGGSRYRQDCAVLAGRTPLQIIMRELKKIRPPLKQGARFNPLSYVPEQIKANLRAAEKPDNDDDSPRQTM